jgi:hypothetical protein
MNDEDRRAKFAAMESGMTKIVNRWHDENAIETMTKLRANVDQHIADFEGNPYEMCKVFDFAIKDMALYWIRRDQSAVKDSIGEMYKQILDLGTSKGCIPWCRGTRKVDTNGYPICKSFYPFVCYEDSVYPLMPNGQGTTSYCRVNTDTYVPPVFAPTPVETAKHHKRGL